MNETQMESFDHYNFHLVSGQANQYFNFSSQCQLKFLKFDKKLFIDNIYSAF